MRDELLTSLGIQLPLELLEIGVLDVYGNERDLEAPRQVERPVQRGVRVRLAVDGDQDGSARSSLR